MINHVYELNTFSYLALNQICKKIVKTSAGPDFHLTQNRTSDQEKADAA